MASIKKIGESWRVLIRRKGHKSICKTFPKKAQAEQFARETEGAMLGGGYLPGSGKLTIAELVDAYKDARDKSGRPVIDTSNEHYVLARIIQDLGDKVAMDLGTSDLVAWCQQIRRGGAGEYTANMYVSKLGTVMRHTASLLDVRLPDSVGQARPTLNHLHLIGAGNARTRRPTADELQRIFAWFAERPQYRPPMQDLITVAITVGLRRSEIFRIKWADIDEVNKMVLVRDRKDPRKKIGNDQWVPLLGESWNIVKQQKRVADRIFPYHPQTVSAYFKMACDALGIVNLHFHDMRHECASALIEAGWNPYEVRLVTGHSRETTQLDTYVNLDPASLNKKVVPISKAEKARKAS